jgi:hypothetical protein
MPAPALLGFGRNWSRSARDSVPLRANNRSTVSSRSRATASSPAMASTIAISRSMSGLSKKYGRLPLAAALTSFR